jgi:acyl-CoA reductase-like NAD-dependent aldehyde dehydrogenase
MSPMSLSSACLKIVHARKLVFTGRTAAGKTMRRVAAENMTRVTQELSGNDPAIVLDDAELDDAAIERLVIAAFLTTGQVFMGIKRVYVRRFRYDELTDGMAEAVDRVQGRARPVSPRPRWDR